MISNMDTRGFARLILDLAKLDKDRSFQDQLSQKPGAGRELAFLLQFAKELTKKQEGNT